jgi:hypothetical protein
VVLVGEGPAPLPHAAMITTTLTSTALERI